MASLERRLDTTRPQWVILLLGVGVALALFLTTRIAVEPGTYIAIVVAAVVGVVLWVSGAWGRVENVVRAPTPRARWMIAVIIGVAAAVIICWAGILQNFQFKPRFVDEFSYLLQMRMLEHGMLWTKALPLPGFFDTYEVLVQPRYASRYPPGTALMFVWAYWANVPVWVPPLLAGSAVVALLYRIVCELVDGVAGILAAVLLMTTEEYLRFSLADMSQVPMLLLSLLAIWAWLRWRKSSSHRWIWAAAAGFFMGWAAITRPSEALLLGIPLAAAFLLGMRRFPLRTSLASIAAGVVMMLPFLGLQIYCNIGITGSWHKLPWTLYAELDQPAEATIFGVGDLNRPPASLSPEKNYYYEKFMVPRIRARQGESLLRQLVGHEKATDGMIPAIVWASLPTPVVIFLLPLGIAAALGLGRKASAIHPGVWIFLSYLILECVYYQFRPLGFEKHYAFMLAPEMILLIVLAARRLPAGKTSSILSSIVCLMLLGVCGQVWVSRSIAASSPEMLALQMRWILLDDVADKLAHLPRQPAVVLFRVDSSFFAADPVFNIDTPWPDEAEVIRARDRGSDNARIFAYYAEHQPNRAFYRYDERSTEGDLVYLGVARELAAHPTTESLQ